MNDPACIRCEPGMTCLGYCEKAMTLDHAIRIVVDVNTRAHSEGHFVIDVGATTHTNAPWYSEAEYVEAWKTLREHLGMQV